MATVTGITSASHQQLQSRVAVLEQSLAASAAARVDTYSATGSLERSSATHYLYNDTGADRTIMHYRASVGTPSSGGPIVIIVHGNESETLTIPAGQQTVSVETSNMWVNDTHISVEIQEVGSSNPGADLTVSVTSI